MTIETTLSRHKCEFNLTKVAWFGFVFDRNGMKLDPKEVEAIYQKATPRSVADVKSFLQMCQYNQSFFI